MIIELQKAKPTLLQSVTEMKVLNDETYLLGLLGKTNPKKYEEAIEMYIKKKEFELCEKYCERYNDSL